MTIEKRGDVIILHPSGDITGLRGCRDLPDEVDDYLEQNFKKFIMNLSEVAHMDSTGLVALFAIHKKVKGAEGQFSVTGVSSKLQKLLRMTDFGSIMPVIETLDEAISRFESG